MKKVISLLLVIIMAVNFVGCSAENMEGNELYLSIIKFIGKFMPDRTITYNFSGEENVGCPETQSVKWGDFMKLDIPQDDNFVFAGWYSDSGCKKYFDFKKERIFSDKTLYARWVDVDDPTDTDGDGVNDSLEDAYGINKNKKAPKSIPTKIPSASSPWLLSAGTPEMRDATALTAWIKNCWTFQEFRLLPSLGAIFWESYTV